MNNLLARIDELRRAGPEVMGNRQWILSGDHVSLRERHDWRHWTCHGLFFLLLGGGAIYCMPPWYFDDPLWLVSLAILGDILVIGWLSGIWYLLTTKPMGLNWREQMMTQPL